MAIITMVTVLQTPYVDVKKNSVPITDQTASLPDRKITYTIIKNKHNLGVISSTWLITFHDGTQTLEAYIVEGSNDGAKRFAESHVCTLEFEATQMKEKGDTNTL